MAPPSRVNTRNQLRPSTSSTTQFEDEAFEDLNLPTRILSNEANLEEYRHETRTGVLLQTHMSRIAGHEEKVEYKLVTFKEGDPENPKNWPKWKKWWCTILISLVCFTVAFCSAVVTADIEGVAETFHVSNEVVFLTITLFVAGFRIGTSSSNLRAHCAPTELFPRRPHGFRAT